jgi:microcystin-dependent protein
MSSPYIGEIRMFGGSFAPAGWAFCDGSLIAISENDALFTLIGTTYGGDGESTFALPNLAGRVPMHQGNGFNIGETGGVEEVTLTTAQLPVHTHTFVATTATPNSTNPQGAIFAQPTATIFNTGTSAVGMNAAAVAPAGGNQPHSNLQPYQCVSYIISLFGIFPSQT